jgi:DNA invertase Pin-like site-specific DNA recombinase
MGVVFLTNSSTDLDREHYLCSTTKIFTDKMSGAKTRPGLDEALAFLRLGDVLVV